MSRILFSKCTEVLKKNIQMLQIPDPITKIYNRIYYFSRHVLLNSYDFKVVNDTA